MGGLFWAKIINVHFSEITFNRVIFMICFNNKLRFIYNHIKLALLNKSIF